MKSRTGMTGWAHRQSDRMKSGTQDVAVGAAPRSGGSTVRASLRQGLIAIAEAAETVTFSVPGIGCETGHVRPVHRPLRADLIAKRSLVDAETKVVGAAQAATISRVESLVRVLWGTAALARPVTAEETVER